MEADLEPLPLRVAELLKNLTLCSARNDALAAELASARQSSFWKLSAGDPSVRETAALADAAALVPRGALGRAAAALEDAAAAAEASAAAPLALGLVQLRRGLFHQAHAHCDRALAALPLARPEGAANGSAESSGAAVSGLMLSPADMLSAARAEACVGRALFGGEDQRGAAAALKRAAGLFQDYFQHASQHASEGRPQHASKGGCEAALGGAEGIDALADWGVALAFSDPPRAVDILAQASAAATACARGGVVGDGATLGDLQASAGQSAVARGRRAARVAYNLGVAAGRSGRHGDAAAALRTALEWQEVADSAAIAAGLAASDAATPSGGGMAVGQLLAAFVSTPLVASSSDSIRGGCKDDDMTPALVLLALGTALARSGDIEAALDATAQATALAQRDETALGVLGEATSDLPLSLRARLELGELLRRRGAAAAAAARGSSNEMAAEINTEVTKAGADAGTDAGTETGIEITEAGTEVGWRADLRGAVAAFDAVLFAAPADALKARAAALVGAALSHQV